MQQGYNNKCSSSGSDKQTKTAVNEHEQNQIAFISYFFVVKNRQKETKRNRLRKWKEKKWKIYETISFKIKNKEAVSFRPD